MPQYIDQNKITAAHFSPFPLYFDELRNSLEKLGYGQPSDGTTRVRLSDSGQPIPLQRLSKGAVDIVYDEQRGFLSIECDSSIRELAEEIHPVFSTAASLPSLMANPKWYEINLVCRKAGKEHPLSMEAIDSKAAQLFEKASGLKPNDFSWSYCSFEGDLPDEPLNQITNWVHVTVSAFVPNPKFYQMRFICRRSNLDTVIKFYDELPNLVEELSDSKAWRE